MQPKCSLLAYLRTFFGLPFGREPVRLPLRQDMLKQKAPVWRYVQTGAKRGAKTAPIS